MFKNIFGSKGSFSKTSFFKVSNERLIAINEVPGNGSINSYIAYLGFPKNHIHIIHTFNSDKIDCLGFKTLSTELVFILAKKSSTIISYLDVQREVNQINWNYEYSSLKTTDILEEGIDSENLDLKFLMSVIDLREDNDNIYKSERLGLYLQFDHGILKAFTSTSWDDSATKWLNNLNPSMVRKMIEEANQYHTNEIDTMEEVNKQANSILGIPQATNNEYISLHNKNNGNVNWYNLLVTHYNKDCNIDEFLFMNKGRLRKINENTIEVGNFIYTFTHGKLESIIKK